MVNTSKLNSTFDAIVWASVKTLFEMEYCVVASIFKKDSFQKMSFLFQITLEKIVVWKAVLSKVH